MMFEFTRSTPPFASDRSDSLLPMLRDAARAKRLRVFPLLVALSAALTACSMPISSVPQSNHSQVTAAASGTIEDDAAARNLYIADAGNGGMLAFHLHASGDVRPIRTIRGGKTGSTSAFNVAFDSKGRVYLSDCCAGIFVYGRNADGNVKPIHHIVGPPSHPLSAFGLAVDAADNLYVANFSDIKVYAPGADGVATPIRDI